MKCGIPSDAIHKEVVIIGNGPSGIALSYMLSGNLPFITSNYHPDEMLSARLGPIVGECLVEQDLEQLAAGLEGRSTNFISLLMDSLLRPCADMGLEMEPLVEFRKAGIEIDHIVLGKGPPGGTWHKMDPYILTLSLGSWMALPGLPFNCRDSGEKRAYASNVAKYYEQYVEHNGLSKYFNNNITVTAVKPIGSQTNIERSFSERNIRNIRRDYERLSVCLDADIPEERNTCFISNAIHCLLAKANRKKNRCCKRPCDTNIAESPSRKIREIENDENDFIRTCNKRDKSRSISLCCDSNNCDNVISRSFQDTNLTFNSLRSSCSLDFSKPKVPTNFSSCYSITKSLEDTWLVTAVDVETGQKTQYSCKYLVLANGANDLPNKLEISEGDKEPDWLLHDLRTLELELDKEVRNTGKNINPVLIVGAGLSAADAVIATRGRNIPVIHVFRTKSSDLNKQLPENLYPEYHKVRQMMKDGGSTYPYYTAYPEFNLTGIDEKSHTVTLTSKTGEKHKVQVSFAAVLIGSRPDLSFFPEYKNVGVYKEIPVDCKTNTIDINKATHRVNGYKNLFAIGPLAGDNFVRFIPGGALAVVAELYRQSRIAQ